jgi:hypothetical protein
VLGQAGALLDELIQEGRLANAFVEKAEIAVTEIINQNVNDVGTCVCSLDSLLDFQGSRTQQVESDGSLEKVVTYHLC